MADSITAEIYGNRAVIDNLSAFSAQIQAQAQAALEQAAQMALDTANSLTPVDTGYLLSRNQVEVNPGSVSVSNDAEYAAPVELGHHTRSGSFVPPQHFLMPAFDETSAWLQSTLRAIVGQ